MSFTGENSGGVSEICCKMLQKVKGGSLRFTECIENEFQEEVRPEDRIERIEKSGWKSRRVFCNSESKPQRGFLGGEGSPPPPRNPLFCHFRKLKTGFLKWQKEISQKRLRTFSLRQQSTDKDA